MIVPVDAAFCMPWANGFVVKITLPLVVYICVWLLTVAQFVPIVVFAVTSLRTPPVSTVTHLAALVFGAPPPMAHVPRALPATLTELDTLIISVVEAAGPRAVEVLKKTTDPLLAVTVPRFRVEEVLLD